MDIIDKSANCIKLGTFNHILKDRRLTTALATLSRDMSPEAEVDPIFLTLVCIITRSYSSADRALPT